MRSKGKMVLVAAMVALIMVPALCGAEMFVEGYVGGNFGANTDIKVSSGGKTDTIGDARLDPAVLGGIKIGYWFTKEGFLGYNYPDWMKYLGVSLDLSYNNLDFRRQQIEGDGTRAWTEGRAFTVALMFTGRYGFLPDSEVPFGRLQPYVSVGPALLLSSMEPAFDAPGEDKEHGGTDTQAEIALMTDIGLRYMALKNVSLDIAFRYRYSEPTHEFTIDGDHVSLRPEYHLLSFYAGAALHF
ncbi:MAG: hypothetical protein PHW74_08585 [Desulfobacca sp.]|nr:hypothetical protein [Desulfobacca sp.]